MFAICTYLRLHLEKNIAQLITDRLLRRYITEEFYLEIFRVLNVFVITTQVLVITIEIVTPTKKIVVLTNKIAEAYFTNRSSWFY